MTNNTPFGTWAYVYRELGMWPRPLIYPGVDKNGKKLGKGCKETGWQLPDPELPPGTIEKWDQKLGHYNIGLNMGSPLPDGTRLGALDIDQDGYTRLGQVLLGNPKCARFGSKGIVLFFRYPAGLKTTKTIKVTGTKEPVIAEFLLEGTICAIPPSIHPDTEEPYRWIGKALHEIDFNELPLIGE